MLNARCIPSFQAICQSHRAVVGQFRFGLAVDDMLLAPEALRRAVLSPFFFVRAAVLLDEHRVIDFDAERWTDGFKVGLVAVAGDLNAVHHAGREVIDEYLGRHPIAVPDQP